MKRLLCHIPMLGLLLAVLLTLPAGALDAGEAASAGETRRVVVLYPEGTDPGEMARTLSELPGCTLLWEYGAFFSGAAVEASGDALLQLEQLALQAGSSHSYSRPLSISDPLESSNSLPMMTGGELPYNGDGIVIAVLDSGLRASHEAFQDYGLAQAPAIAQSDIDRFISEGGTAGRYLSPRIPFAYDYAGRDDDVSTADSHGTHVSAIALGYARREDGSVKFQGAAPAAQLLSLKVFPDASNSTTDDAVLIRALEDAYRLGADVINLSLGRDNGFTADPLMASIYEDIFQRLQEEGVAVFAAAGNSDAVTTQKLHGVPLPTADYADYGSVASPGTFESVISVAAADAMTYERSGYIAAGGEKLTFTDCASEIGETLPVLSSLAGQELEYVVVGGLGADSDYAGLDVSGRVALVRRGEITFTEKAQTAAAHGAAACLVYNNEPTAILPAGDGIPIPCAIISLEDGERLLALAGDAGLGALLVSDGAYTETLHTRPTASASSAWGTTSDLRLVPAVTAPGGFILSATAEGDDTYDYFSGTSMATPNASGAFALLLQALRSRDPSASPAETLQLAQALLECTASPMRDDNDILVSPRKQGAGLIDLDKALSSELVITQPLLTLGEQEKGRFTARLQVKNFSDQDAVLSVGVYVLTDGWDTDDTGTYSLMTSRDITDQVTIGGDTGVTVPAGKTAEAAVTITIPESLRTELSDVFTNGFFAEGYITLTSPEGQGVQATFLGFCGDWDAAPILDPVDFRDVLNARALLAQEIDEETGSSYLELGYDFYHILPVNTWANLPYITDDPFNTLHSTLLGENPWASVPHLDQRNAMSTPDSDALYTGGHLFAVDAFTLRNAAHLIMVVSDQDSGEIYYVDDTQWLPKAIWNSTSLQMDASAWFYWDGTNRHGQPLPDGTQVLVRFYGWLDSDESMMADYENAHPVMLRPQSYGWLISGRYESRLQWSFPLTLDGSAPTVAVSRDGGSLSIEVTDEQYLAYVSVYDEENNLLAESTFASERPGETHTLTVTPEAMPQALYITVGDYASNTTGYRVELSAGMEPSPCAMALLSDVDRDAWYHEAVDYVYTAGLMAGSDPLTFRPGDAATRAQVLNVFYLLEESPSVSGTLEQRGYAFTDVRSDAEYMDALLWALDMGLVTGYNDTTFGAFASISRQQLAVMLYRYAALASDAPLTEDTSVLVGFPDGGQVSSWAAPAMAWAVEAGLFSGRPGGALEPRGYATRAELAQILMDFLTA